MTFDQWWKNNKPDFEEQYKDCWNMGMISMLKYYKFYHHVLRHAMAHGNVTLEEIREIALKQNISPPA